MELALAILLISALTTNGLLALLAATSRRHWFLRTALYLVGPALLLLAPASEVATALVGQGLVVAGGVYFVARRRKARQQSEDASRGIGSEWRFSIATFLLAMVLVCVGAAVAAKFPSGNLLLAQSILLISVCGGLMTLLGDWAARRLTWRDAVGATGAAALGGLVLGLPLAWFDWFTVSFIDFSIGWPPEPSPQASLIQIFIGDAAERPVVLWLAIGAGVAVTTMTLARLAVAAGMLTATAASTDKLSSSLQRKFAGGMFAIVAISAALPSALAWQRMVFPNPIPEVVLPQPNGYDDFVAASQRLKADVTTNPNLMFEELIDTRTKLEATVRNSAPALKLLRQGLGKESMTPPNYTNEDLSAEMDFMMGVRDLGRALNASGRLAALENRFGDALQDNLDSVRLGMAVRRGGMLVDIIFGMAVAREGLDGVNRIRNQLSSAQRNAAIRVLAELYASMEGHDEFERRDRIWSQHAQGWHGRLDLALCDAAGEYDLFDRAHYRAMCLRERSQVALLILQLSLLNVIERDGRAPENLNSIELPHREEICTDPFGDGSAFRYARKGDGFLLYSVGVDGADDGGKAPVFEEDESFGVDVIGDLLLDDSFENGGL
jgi:hypothetical protein